MATQVDSNLVYTNILRLFSKEDLDDSYKATTINFEVKTRPAKAQLTLGLAAKALPGAKERPKPPMNGRAPPPNLTHASSSHTSAPPLPTPQFAGMLGGGHTLEVPTTSLTLSEELVATLPVVSYYAKTADCNKTPIFPSFKYMPSALPLDVWDDVCEKVLSASNEEIESRIHDIEIEEEAERPLQRWCLQEPRTINVPSLPRRFRRDRDRVICLARQPLLIADHYHLSLLFLVYKHLTGVGSTPDLRGEHWAGLGYNSESPIETDLNEPLGLLSIIHLLGLLAHYPDLVLETFPRLHNSEQYFPFATVSYKITRLAYEQLRSGKLSKRCKGNVYRASGCVVFDVLFETYCALFWSFIAESKQLGGGSSHSVSGVLPSQHLSRTTSKKVVHVLQELEMVVDKRLKQMIKVFAAQWTATRTPTA
eukprot:Platyproteum_vivax@DN14864_c0_g1_i1.p1